MSERWTPAGIQAAVDAGLVTWADVLDVLRSDMHIPEGAIEEWRPGPGDCRGGMVREGGPRRPVDAGTLSQ